MSKQFPPVLVSGIVQFQLVHIHPFLDGNGRTARLLSTLCLYKFGYDFKKLFTISEYYDRNRANYYKAIQSVRDKNMDMTVWLEYFSKALETQMQEIQLKGTHAIKLDILVAKYKLSKRQKQILQQLLETNEDFTIQQYESFYPDINRRTLQRDLSDLVGKRLISQMGKKKVTYYRINLD
ncbi:Fic family protein [Candidatus Rhabdochlamydia porcellionis]|uniref:Fic family protein n=1 Tax=Candidatus Rhabdochlamydia porcellionis TaxID=225148 RepID=UPI0033130729